MARSVSSADDKALDLVEAVAGAERPQRRLGELARSVSPHRATPWCPRATRAVVSAGPER